MYISGGAVVDEPEDRPNELDASELNGEATVGSQRSRLLLLLLVLFFFMLDVLVIEVHNSIQ